MLKSSLCDYSPAYNFVKGTISITTEEGDNPSNLNKQKAFKNCSPFTDCISKIDNAQIDNAKDTDVVMPMYNLIEYCNNYSKASVSLWQYYTDEPALTDAGAIANFSAAFNNNASYIFKQKITGKTADRGTKNVEINVPIIYVIFGELLKCL